MNDREKMRREHQRCESLEQAEWLSDRDLCVRYRIGSRATIWRWVEQGLLPSPHKLSPNTTRWHRPQIEAADAAKREANEVAPA